MLIIIIYGDGLAQRFVVELDGGLVMDDTIIGYVNKLTTIVALLQFSSEVFTIHNDWLVAILILTSRWPQSILSMPETYVSFNN